MATKSGQETLKNPKRLKGQDLEFFVEHYTSLRAAYRTQIYFCFDTKVDGKSAFVMLKRVYADECDYSAYGIDYRDFYLGFKSQTVRNQVLQDIEDCVSEFQAANNVDLTLGTSETGPDKKEVDWTTYIIIGIAAAVILLLLWDKRK